MITYRVHPFAELFPRLAGEEYQAFLADIAEHGQREPIVRLEDGTVIDGRNRLAALAELGIEPIFKTWQPRHDGDTPQAYIISENLRRRHMTNTERALVAARLADHPEGNIPAAERSTVTREADAARAMKVSVRSVGRAKAVIKKGVAELVDAVKSGAVALRPAADLAQKPPSAQRAALGAPRKSHHGPNEYRPTLADEIRDFIEALQKRRVSAIPAADRVTMCAAFARALKVAEGRTWTVPQSLPRHAERPDAPKPPEPATPLPGSADPVADFLAKGGAITRCPPTINPTAAEAAALAEHAERQEERRQAARTTARVSSGATR